MLMTVSWTSGVRSAGEDDFLQFSTRTEFSCLIFFRINIQLRGHPCQKKTITNSLKLQIVLLMLLMAVIISSSCSYTTGKSELPPPPTPPPPPHTHTHTHTKHRRQTYPYPTRKFSVFQWQHDNILFAAICIPRFVSVLFSKVEFRIKATNQQ